MEPISDATAANAWIGLIGFVVGASMLWLGSHLHAIGNEFGQLPKLLSRVVWVIFMASGIWWPLHNHDMTSTASVVGFMVAVGMAPLASAVAQGSLASSRITSFLLGGFGLSMLFVLASRDGATGSHVGLVDLAAACLMAAVLWGAMVTIHLRTTQMLPPALTHGLSALMAALVIVIAGHGRHGQVAWAHIGLQLIVIVTVMTFVGVMALVFQSSKHRVQAVVKAKDLEAVSNDPLTRLSTRRSFERQQLAAAKRADREHLPMALLYIDLDGFKAVNDSFGHADGDRLLVDMSKRLNALAREGDIVARVGADEMLILMREDVTTETVGIMTHRILQRLSRPYRLQQREVTLTCSVGVARYPKHGPVENLIARADAAAQVAKRDGGGRVVTYDKSMDSGAREKLALTTDLRMAIERGEFELYYQPKVDASSLQITAAEALIRWHHPKRGMVSPVVFIPLAEQTGLILQLGDWVIEDALRQAAKWRHLGLRMRVAINLSAMQLRKEGLVQQIVGLLRKYGVEASQITCEITESVAMGDADITQKTLEALGRAGLHLSIDDFGTGYSSLSYLRRLPAQEVKIDRSFVMDLETSEDARAVADAVVKLAHALGKKVVAEGVETPRQAKILVDLGCNHLQGYLYGKPMPAADLTAWALGHGGSGNNPRSVPFRDSLFIDGRAGADRMDVAAAT